MPGSTENTVGLGQRVGASPPGRGAAARGSRARCRARGRGRRPAGPSASMITRAGDRVGLDADRQRQRPRRTAASSASITACWPRRTSVVDREVARRGLADEQRPRHVAPVALDLGAEVEQQDRVRAGSGRSPGEPCGSAASGPDRQATSNASASAPPVRISHSSRSASVALGHARPGSPAAAPPARDPRPRTPRRSARPRRAA